MAVTADEYELPIAVANSPSELGKMVGVSENTVSSAISHNQNGKTRGYKFIMVIVEDEEE